MWSAVLVLTASVLLLTETSAQNGFDAIIGCKQQAISRPSYNLQNPYYAIDQFRDVQTVEVAGLKIKTIKLSVVASNDAVIRLAPVDQPYKNTLMNEIVLSGWGNTINAVRQYVRSSPSRVSRNVIVVNQPSGRMLSPYQPFVFTLSIINDYMVILTKVGESLPFLQYVNAAVQPNYIGFSNWNAPVSVFYDCPPLSSPSPPPPPPPPTQKPPATTAPCQQQTISRPSYNLQNPYYAIDQFRDVRTVEVAGLKIQTIKLSVMASNDAVIRLAPIAQPYQNTLMNEIVLSGWGNTINAVRLYVRSSPSRVSSNVIVVNQPSGRMLSPNQPFVFTLSIINDYMVVLTKVGESLPFLQYVNSAVQPKYIGFSNWNAPVSVVYDCPPPPPPSPPPTPPATTATPTTTSEVTAAPGSSTTSEATAAPGSSTTSEATAAPGSSTTSEATAAPGSSTTSEATAAPVSSTTSEATAAPGSSTTSDATAAPGSSTTSEATAAPGTSSTSEATVAPGSSTTSEATAAPGSSTTSEATAAPGSSTTSEATAAPGSSTTSEATAAPGSSTTSEATAAPGSSTTSEATAAPGSSTTSEATAAPGSSSTSEATAAPGSPTTSEATAAPGSSTTSEATAAPGSTTTSEATITAG